MTKCALRECGWTSDLLRRNRLKPLTRPLLPECCHHDPDLIQDARPRPPGDWRGIFGQSGNEQNDLAEVAKGDLFLFFGLFQEAGQVNGALGFLPGSRDFHAFFGYLQVGERFHVQTDQKIPEKYGCFADHPHLTPERLKHQGGGGYADNNTVYIADESFSLDSKFRGWGVFRFAPELILTKEWRTPAFWSLPDFLQGKRIGHRPRHDAWKSPDGAFRSPDIGHQEIVMDADDKLKEWALGIIRAGMRED